MEMIKHESGDYGMTTLSWIMDFRNHETLKEFLKWKCIYQILILAFSLQIKEENGFEKGKGGN